MWECLLPVRRIYDRLYVPDSTWNAAGGLKRPVPEAVAAPPSPAQPSPQTAPSGLLSKMASVAKKGVEVAAQKISTVVDETMAKV